MPDPFKLPFRGMPTVDIRIWHTLFGDKSPSASYGTERMLYASIYAKQIEFAQ